MGSGRASRRKCQDLQANRNRIGERKESRPGKGVSIGHSPQLRVIWVPRGLSTGELLLVCSGQRPGMLLMSYNVQHSPPPPQRMIWSTMSVVPQLKTLAEVVTG